MNTLRRLSLGRGFNAQHFAHYYFMRLLPHAPSRRRMAALLANRVARRHPGTSAFVREASAPHTATSRVLQSDGRVVLPPLLTATQVAEVRTYLSSQLATDGARSFLAGSAPLDARRARYPVPTILACPHILETINRPDVLALANQYLGCPATISSVGIHWSFPSGGNGVDVQRFPRDTDDWRFLKLFIYLTDVDEGSGPHEYVNPSHLTSGRLRLTPYTDDEVVRRYGAQRVVKVLGPAGTTFMEDTWGIHKGGVPVQAPRLLLQVQYSVLPVSIYEYRPVKTGHGGHYDRYSNRLLLSPAE